MFGARPPNLVNMVGIEHEHGQRKLRFTFNNAVANSFCSRSAESLMTARSVAAER